MAQNWHFWSNWARPCRLIRCPVAVEGSVGGFGARAVSRKTPIYFIISDLKFGTLRDARGAFGNCGELSQFFLRPGMRDTRDTEENCGQCVVVRLFPCPHNVHTPPNEETELSELIKCPALNSNSLLLVAKVHFLR